MSFSARERRAIKYGNKVPSLYAEVRAKALWFCSGGGGVFLFAISIIRVLLVLLVFYYRAAAAAGYCF